MAEFGIFAFSVDRGLKGVCFDVPAPSAEVPATDQI